MEFFNLDMLGIFQFGNFWNHQNWEFMEFLKMDIFKIFAIFQIWNLRNCQNWKFIIFAKLKIYGIFGIFQIGHFQKISNWKINKLLKLFQFGKAKFGQFWNCLSAILATLPIIFALLHKSIFISNHLDVL